MKIYYKVTTDSDGFIIQVESSDIPSNDFVEYSKNQVEFLCKPQIKLVDLPPYEEVIEPTTTTD